MNMQACASRAAVVVAVVAILGGCSKSAIPTTLGPAANGPAAVSDARKGKKQTVKLHIKVPRAPKGARGKALRPYFVASSTMGVKIVVYAHGPHATPLATTLAGLTSANCTPVTGGRNCTISAESPVGNDDFEVTTYNAPPSGGSFGTAKQLAVGSTTKQVLLGAANVISLTLGGVVASAGVALPTATVPAIDTASQTIVISGKDADGNTIIGSGWFDATGNPVTMAISSDQPSVTFSPSPNIATFSAPTSQLTYWSQDPTPAEIQSGFTATITATPSNAGSTPGSSILNVAKPAFTEFLVGTMSSGAENIEVGPDNAIWFSEPNVDQLGRIATNAVAGSSSTDYGGLTMSASPRTLANGSDGKIWFAEFGLGKVASMDPTTHVVAEYSTPGGAGDHPYGMLKGPDGDMWFTENCSLHSNVGKFNPATPGTVTEYPALMSSAPQSIAVGSDNNLWFTEPSSATNAVAKITTAGVRTDYSVAPSNGIYEGGILNGPDQAIWFAECNHSGNSIGRIPTSGSPIAYYPLLNAASEPTTMVNGPDGAIWFVEQNQNAIGRITIATHTIVEFPIPTLNSGPFGITLGPDGALWFTEADGNKIGKLQ